MKLTIARAVMAVADRSMGLHRRQWSEAMHAEFDAAADAGEPLSFALGPSLFDYREPNGQIIPALIQTTKVGQIFFLNRLTGAPITAITERPVRTDGATPGVRVSATQPFSTGMPSFTPPAPTEVATWGATPIDQLFCRIDIRRARGTGIYSRWGRSRSSAIPLSTASPPGAARRSIRCAG